MKNNELLFYTAAILLYSCILFLYLYTKKGDRTITYGGDHLVKSAFNICLSSQNLVGISNV